MSLLILLCNNHESTINRQILDIDGYDTVRDYKEKLKKTSTRAKLYKRTHSLNQNQAVRQTTAPQYGASRG